ncbi:MAG: hypothetical protein WED33_12350 [Bacteroidia bacterium]
MRNLLITGAMIFIAPFIMAQSIDDAVRYSQTNSGGTALSMGMGGATGAVGGDFSNAVTNPAGLGLFRQSEFAGSLSLFNSSTSSDFYGSGEDDRKFNFNIQNLHLVIHYPTVNRLKKTGWMGSTLAIGYNKTSNLGERWTFRGFNPNSSLVDAIAQSANGIQPDQLSAPDQFVAYQTFLIDPVTDSSGNIGYTSLLGPAGGDVTQRGTMDSRGRIGETSISFAANHSNRFYIGAGLSIRRIIFERDFTYTERDDADSIASFNSFTYTNTLSDRATAVAFRGGIIYRVNDHVRLGASAFVPLDYTVNTDYNYSINSDLSSGQYSSEFPGTFKYKLRLPSRFTGSAAFILGKKGLVSVDYETVNYSKNRLIDDSGLFDNTNDVMRTRLTNTGNLRIGGEARFDDLYARAGFQLLGNPYNSNTNNQAIKMFSLGGGYRVNDFYIDLAYVLSIQEKNYYPYNNPNIADIQPAILNLQKHQLIVSMGTRF